jgi:uncharacterized protein YkwD
MIGARRTLAFAVSAGILLLSAAPPALAASVPGPFTPDAWFQPVLSVRSGNVVYPDPAAVSPTTWGTTVVVYWGSGVATGAAIWPVFNGGAAPGGTTATVPASATGSPVPGGATVTVLGSDNGAVSSGTTISPTSLVGGVPANLSDGAAQIEGWTDAIRAQHGLPPLADNTLLDRIALLKCQDMLANNYFGDDSPTYGTPLQMQQAFGIQARIMGAENLAGAGSTALAWSLLVHSPGHLANILYNGLTEQGAAVVAYGVNGVYVCQEFIGN